MARVLALVVVMGVVVARAIRAMALVVGVIGVAAGVMGAMGCEGGTPPVGIAPARDGEGPIVRFDLFARPLPEVPLPNDLATRPDRSSATGRRINASLVASTAMESGIRAQLDGLDGWGTYSPVSVAFDCPGDVDGICIDLGNLMTRHPRGDFEFADDAVYLVDVTRGSPTFGKAMPVDLGQGGFPFSVDRFDRYYDNDTRQGSTQIVFEEVNEEDADGDGEPDPDEDLNGDGRLGRANVWPPGSDAATGLVTSYEMATNTLIMRPVLPLRETTTYAVVITDRLTGEGGWPVRSPFPWINHLEQTGDLEPLAGILAGDPGTFGGLGIDGVGFAWTFTTQSVTRDLREIRRGLYGEGPFARLEEKYEPDLVVNQLWGCNPFGTGSCELPENEFTLGMGDLAPILGEYAETLLTEDPEDVNALLDSYLFVDYAVIGHYWSPNFLDSDGDGTEEARWQSEDLDGDGRLDVSEDEDFDGEIDEGEDRDHDGHLDHDEDENRNGRLDVVSADEGVWKVDGRTGAGRESPGWVSVFITIPKEEYRPVPGEPFPVVLYGHGYTAFNLEVFGFAGTMARFGFATVAVNCVHHGLGFDSIIMDTVRSIFQTNDMAPAGDALTDDRALDPDRDGSKESGGDFWTSYITHTRDVVRQSALDHFEMIRILRSFDGVRRAGPLDMDGDGRPEQRWDYVDWELDEEDPDENRLVGDLDADGDVELAGDFDADGVVDLGGPDAGYYVWGQSLGGIMSALMGGLDPSIRAIAPTSGGGGLSDIAVRDDDGGVRRAVVLRMLAPIVVSGIVDQAAVDGGDTGCEAGQVSLRFQVPDVNDETRVEFGCLDPELAVEGNVMLAENLVNGEYKCAMFRGGGAVRATLPSDAGDEIRITVWRDGDIARTDTCEPLPGEEPLRTVDTWEVKAEYQYLSWSAGEPLCAPTEGYGLDRNTPEIRRLLSLAQIALEPGDPINHAPHYFLEPFQNPEDQPHHVNALVIGTAGDRVVPINTAAAQMRAAGILDVWEIDERYGKTDNQLLVDNWVLEGVESYGRSYPDDWSGRCDTEPCSILFDPDDLDMDTDGYLSPAPEEPLRLWRPSVPDSELEAAVARCEVETGSDPATGREWIERIVCPDGVSAGLFPTIFPDGEHGFYIPDPALPFDINTYLVNQIGLYFKTDGTELNFAACQHDSTCAWIPPLPDKPPGWPIIGD